MTANLRHWTELGRTDPKHTKPFTRAGGFKGTATKPIWIEYRLTEHFGPCGVGWGCDEPAFTLVPAADEILVFCTVAAWYIDDGKRATLYGVGGDKVLVKQQSGLRSDDEAYKKAFTDALGNAFKHVGSGADVHMGLFDDSKYVSEMKREFAEDAPAPAPQQVAPTPRAVHPEEPPQIAEGRDEFVRQFWKREWYGLDPEVVDGGMPRWDYWFLLMARSAPNLDALNKLKDDNGAFYKRWFHAAAPAVSAKTKADLVAIGARFQTQEAAE